MDANMQQGKVYSTTDFMTLIIKIFGIIGMIFIGISILIPWSAYAIPYTTDSLGLNGWGVSTNIPQSL